ncbi:alpha/beta hydrolase [Cohnella thailandensis]|uniref:alpha/beta hydrolase n=1 Tax=Cohnella thailandensis TaxID=557557 RepID=UPI001DF6292A|nr:alpha/beta hydrolase-fold protein [Cohnella thailandensis]MBP1972899.1 putative alpha/beta superfamily hydrolase [Cohnella thailandensis]
MERSFYGRGCPHRRWRCADNRSLPDSAASDGAESLDLFAGELAVDHGGDERNHEYNLTINAEYGFGGKGEAYAAFLAETLKPYIDSRYRTLPEPEHTIIGGSSFGAYVSLFAAIRYPHLFGLVGGISFVMWHDDGAILELIRQSVLSPALRVFLSIGELETDNPEFNRLANEHVALARRTLIAAGVPESRIRFDVVPGGTHHESRGANCSPKYTAGCSSRKSHYANKMDRRQACSQ